MSFGGSGGGGGSLASGSDVALNNATNGQVLSYNGSIQKWQNTTAVNGGGNSPQSTSSGTLASSTVIDLGNQTGTVFRATLGNASTAISFTNVAAGARWTMELRQDATGGRSATWNGVTWIPAGPPVLASAPSGVDLFEFVSSDGITIYGVPITPHATGTTVPYQSGARFETFPRLFANSSGQMQTGVVYLTHFIADRDQVVTTFNSVAQTAQSGATTVRIGLYIYAGSSVYTCVARSANNTSNLWSNTAMSSIAIADDGSATPNAITSYTVRAGVEYAIATICVGATVQSRLASVTVIPAIAIGSAPRISTQLTGQTDLPATLTTSQNPSFAFWAALT